MLLFDGRQRAVALQMLCLSPQPQSWIPVSRKGCDGKKGWTRIRRREGGGRGLKEIHRGERESVRQREGERAQLIVTVYSLDFKE